MPEEVPRQHMEPRQAFESGAEHISSEHVASRPLTGDAREPRARNRALLLQGAVHRGIQGRHYVIAEVAAQAAWRGGGRRCGARSVLRACAADNSSRGEQACTKEVGLSTFSVLLL